MPRRSHLPLPLELIAGALGKLLYRVRALGAENVPASGGGVLVANHLSYVDVVVLQLACRRPLRFMAHEGPGQPRFFPLLFRLARVISLAPGRPIAGMRQAVKALRAGEIVCVFPEGQISRTGQLMGLRPGFATLARRAGVPVVPAAIDGLWGSVFSFAGNRYIWKSPRLTRTAVCVAFGRPIPPGGADRESARRALLDLGAEAFGERPVLRRHFGREVVRELAKRPGRRVIVDCTAARREISAAQLLVVSGALSRRLRRTAEGGRVGIVLPPGAGAFIANLAVICAGKVPVNLNFTSGRVALEASMAAAGIRTVLTAEAVRERVPDFPWPAGTLDIRAEIGAAMKGRAILPWLLAVWLLPNQWVAGLLGLPRIGDRAEAALLFTSGSSGDPKGVVLTHRNILANCAQISSLSILPRTCTLLGCLPLFHSFGFTVTLCYPLMRGCTLVTVPSPLDTRKIAETIAAEQVTVLVGAPTFLRPLLRRAKRAELRSLELVVAGAERLTEELQQDFLEAFHIEILQGYGLTETAPVASVNQPNPPTTTATAGRQEGKRRGAVGRLMPGMTARIVDPESGANLPLTARGVVCLRGTNVFSGYLGGGAAEDAAFRDGWFVTGDIGGFDDDGFLHIEGRLSRFSKIGGEMVPHGRIEETLAEAFALDQSEGPAVLVIGVPDAEKGEALVLLSTVDLDPAAVRQELARAGLPNIWIPKRFRRVDKLPLLGSGKVDLRACRDIAAGPSNGEAV